MLFVVGLAFVAHFAFVAQTLLSVLPALCVSGFGSPMDSTGVLKSDPILHRDRRPPLLFGGILAEPLPAFLPCVVSTLEIASGWRHDRP